MRDPPGLHHPVRLQRSLLSRGATQVVGAERVRSRRRDPEAVGAARFNPPSTVPTSSSSIRPATTSPASAGGSARPPTSRRAWATALDRLTDPAKWVKFREEIKRQLRRDPTEEERQEQTDLVREQLRRLDEQVAKLTEQEKTLTATSRATTRTTASPSCAGRPTSSRSWNRSSTTATSWSCRATPGSTSPTGTTSFPAPTP